MEKIETGLSGHVGFRSLRLSVGNLYISVLYRLSGHVGFRSLRHIIFCFWLHSVRLSGHVGFRSLRLKTTAIDINNLSGLSGHVGFRSLRRSELLLACGYEIV